MLKKKNKKQKTRSFLQYSPPLLSQTDLNLPLFICLLLSSQSELHILMKMVNEQLLILKKLRASQVALGVRILPASAGRVRDTGLIPGSGRSPRGGHGNPLQYSCLENPMDRGTGGLQSIASQLDRTEETQHTHARKLNSMNKSSKWFKVKKIILPKFQADKNSFFN